jgi:predicted transcriptional regulator YdeE
MLSMDKIVFEKRNFPHDLKVFGMHVRSFPNGIGEAFDSLIERMPPEPKRSYFGISEMATNGDILYYAAAEETFEGEARQYGFDIYIVKQGEYLTVTVNDWRKKTTCIKDVFEAMLDDVRIDKENPCIEWYKNDDEMVCMVRLNTKI